MLRKRLQITSRNAKIAVEFCIKLFNFNVKKLFLAAFSNWKDFHQLLTARKTEFTLGLLVLFQFHSPFGSYILVADKN